MILRRLLFFFSYLMNGLEKTKYLRKMGLVVGENCEILNKISDFGSEPWLIEIGNKVTICSGVALITHDASSRLFRNNYDFMNHKFGNKFGNIKIHDNCFIGTNSIILPGITIGPNSIVGAGSVVTRDVKESSVVAGNPAKQIFDLDHYIEKYIQNMITIDSVDRDALRKELTERFFGGKTILD